VQLQREGGKLSGPQDGECTSSVYIFILILMFGIAAIFVDVVWSVIKKCKCI